MDEENITFPPLLDNPLSDSSDSDLGTMMRDDTSSEETFSNGNNGVFDEELFNPLYSGSTTTTCGAYYATMHFAIENKLPYTAINNLLQLLKLLCPQPSNLPKSFYKLKKFFKAFGASYETKEYCVTCQSSGADTARACCSCTTEKGHLVHINLNKALQTLGACIHIQ